MNVQLDHLVITAASVSAGCDWVEAKLGVRPQPGGEHPEMGTHNALLKLSNTTFLEVIAINPSLPASFKPQGARWFGLDTRSLDAPLCISHWVVATNHIAQAAQNLPFDCGAALPRSRGAYHWRFTIPNDGQQPLGNAAPALIEWGADCGSPAKNLTEMGINLQSLEIHTAFAASLKQAFALWGLSGIQVVQDNAASTAQFSAVFQTPLGLVNL